MPATIAVLDGVPVVGVDRAALEPGRGGGRGEAQRPRPAARGRDAHDGATTVAATAHLAAQAGIRVFATGGLGGVHRGAAESWDESADLFALARLPIVVVAAGVKSILDVGATLERLETLGVSVAGWRTTRFPGFYLSDSGFDVPWTLETPEQAAAALTASVGSALVVANPIAADRQLDPELHDRVLAEGLALAAAQGVSGKAVTPFLLAHLHEATGGRSLEVNVELAVATRASRGRSRRHGSLSSS